MTRGRLAAMLANRARIPKKGGWATDPRLTERRLIRMSPDTLRRLERIVRELSTDRKKISPMLVAALLLEDAVMDATKVKRR